MHPSPYYANNCCVAGIQRFAIRARAMSTPPRGKEVTLSYRVLAYPYTDFHRADIAPSRVRPHWTLLGDPALRTFRINFELPQINSQNWGTLNQCVTPAIQCAQRNSCTLRNRSRSTGITGHDHRNTHRIRKAPDHAPHREAHDGHRRQTRSA